MTFLTLDVQKNYMVLQKSQLEYQEMLSTNQKQQVVQEISNLYSQYENENKESGVTTGLQDTQKQELEKYNNLQQKFDTEISTIETQLKTLNSQIESYEKAIDTNVKGECKFSISC